MEVRTFYWEDHIISRPEYLVRKIMGKVNNSQFVYGNAGDIYARDLLSRQYDVNVKNVTNEGKRLLCVGSIAHRALSGDVLCGVGVKNPNLILSLERKEDTLIYGLRGPLSYDILKRAGFDVTTVKFLYDPGLLIKFVHPTAKQPTGISFIPHYRERYDFRNKLPKGIRLIDIDNHPHTVAKEICASKLVYSSSLHGIIFSHALGIPCIYVKPQTNESEFKFIDYYESVNLTYKKPLSSIFDADFKRDSDTPADVNVELSDFQFPSVQELKEWEVII